MLVKKSLHGGLEILGGDQYIQGAYGIYTGGNSQVGGTFQVLGTTRLFSSLQVDTTSWLRSDVSIGEPAVGTTTLTVYGLITVPAGPGFTSGLIIERDASFVGDIGINGDLTLEPGHTLKVDNIFKSNSGLGELIIEGIGVEGSFLYVDNIAEKTAANGVRIDQLRILDNTINHITPGTEILLEEDTRIRDPHKLEVSNIYEADLSSNINLWSRVYAKTSFYAESNVTFSNIISTAEKNLLMVNTSGQVSETDNVNWDESGSVDILTITGKLKVSDVVTTVDPSYTGSGPYTIVAAAGPSTWIITACRQSTAGPSDVVSTMIVLAFDGGSFQVDLNSYVMSSFGTAPTFAGANQTGSVCDITISFPASTTWRISALRVA